mmetsp:Transcript_744/g.2493  ORF Transcript_744/g.2493 Transcript_744/m.2493 type:complete len:301 (-) Transcript_744:14-916(-)
MHARARASSSAPHQPDRVRPASKACHTPHQASVPYAARNMGSLAHLLGALLLRLDHQRIAGACAAAANAHEHHRRTRGSEGEGAAKPRQEAHPKAAGLGDRPHLLGHPRHARHRCMSCRSPHGRVVEVGERLADLLRLFWVRLLLVVDTLVEGHRLARRPRAEAGLRLGCHALVDHALHGREVHLELAPWLSGRSPLVPLVLPRLAGGGDAIARPRLLPEAGEGVPAHLRGHGRVAEGRQLGVSVTAGGDVVQHALAPGGGTEQVVGCCRGKQGHGDRPCGHCGVEPRARGRRAPEKGGR